jgi:hypothetical protein
MNPPGMEASGAYVEPFLHYKIGRNSTRMARRSTVSGKEDL